jgi:hypothetical protein
MPVVLEKSECGTEQSKGDQTGGEQGQRRVVRLQEGFDFGHWIELYLSILLAFSPPFR